MSSVADANDRFYQALNANIAGDTGPMHAIWSHADDITNSGPFGGRQVGPDAVLANFDREAAMGMSGEVVAEDVHVVSGSDLGYALCVETLHMMAGGQPVEGSHRATNVYRLEADGWKLVHHHTDLTPALDA